MKKNILENLAAVTAGKVKTSGVSAFNELEISKVFPNPDQPRKQFDDIEGLAATILEHGLLQPITVVKKDDGYMIIAGERRYKAHLYNQAKTIKAYIVDVSEEQVEELTLIENIQRNDLTDFELAKHICKLWDSGRYEKKSDLATRIGKSDSYVSKSFNCLKLDSEIIDHIEQNKTPISISVMDEIARVKDPVVQKEVYEKYNNKEITRDEIKEFKKEENSPREIFNETFTFSKHGWTNMFFGYIKQDWIFKRLKDNEHYELKIKEISTFSDDIKDEKREISFTLEMTKNFKDTFKSMFDHWSFAKCKFLEVGKYYKVTIRPNGKVYALSFEDPDYDKNRLDETAALKQKIKELEKEIEELKQNKLLENNIAHVEIHGNDEICNKTTIKLAGDKNRKGDNLTFYLPNNGNHKKLNGYLEIDGLKDYSSYDIVITKI